MGEISITKLLVVAALIILVFGTKKVTHAGWRPGLGYQRL
ncbi:twin arginine translocase protein E [Klebsiella michiganensis]|nr:twin arginine translocase protein E [Klebsiella michiganensis]